MPVPNVICWCVSCARKLTSHEWCHGIGNEHDVNDMPVPNATCLYVCFTLKLPIVEWWRVTSTIYQQQWYPGNKMSFVGMFHVLQNFQVSDDDTATTKTDVNDMPVPNVICWHVSCASKPPSPEWWRMINQSRVYDMPVPNVICWHVSCASTLPSSVWWRNIRKLKRW